VAGTVNKPVIKITWDADSDGGEEADEDSDEEDDGCDKTGQTMC
jgi:hypothetical protein